VVADGPAAAREPASAGETGGSKRIGLLQKEPAHGSALRERADGNCVGSQVLPIANFRESRNDQLFRYSLFFRFAVAIFRRQPHTLILTTIWQKL
jgi:hypothetical protein